MPSPSSGQGTLTLDTPAPATSPASSAAPAAAPPRPPAGTLVTRLDVELDERRARLLAFDLELLGYRDVAGAIRDALEELGDGGGA